MPKKLMNAEQERFGADFHAVNLKNRGSAGAWRDYNRENRTGEERFGKSDIVEDRARP
jgi:hypothetical protein